MTEHFLVGFDYLLGNFLTVDVKRRQTDQLLFAFAGQQFHRPVTARELFVFVAVIDQIR
ncbi:hypothetical protein D3C75_1210720 [compost metagenome]